MVYRNNTGRLGSGFISVCLEIRWLGHLGGFYVPERPCKGAICAGTAPLFSNLISLFGRPRTRLVGKIWSPNQSINASVLLESCRPLFSTPWIGVGLSFSLYVYISKSILQNWRRMIAWWRWLWIPRGSQEQWFMWGLSFQLHLCSPFF